jgi:hypothetical protein
VTPADGSAKVDVLLSIHLSSNRPAQFVRFLDCLMSATHDPSCAEVVVHIDDGDDRMHGVVKEQAATRPLRIKFVSRPRNGGFYGLWRAFDDLLRATSPTAYFVVNFNDEMYFKTPGWDTRLRKYVELFPDRIFRLKTSDQRFRNYYDFWEAGFANDTSAIMTKRWLELGGGWCPCNGPDSFQQCVAFYFGWLDRFNAQRPYRELAVHDLEIGGAGANRELRGRELRDRLGGAIRPWFVLMSHTMQEEAARRARKLHAHIWLHEHGLANAAVRDNRMRRRIEIADDGGRILHSLPYGLSALRIGLTNRWRLLNYAYYGGGGALYARRLVRNTLAFLSIRYEAVYRLRQWLRPLFVKARDERGPRNRLDRQ